MQRFTDFSTHLMRTLQARHLNLLEFSSTKLLYRTIKLPTLLAESNMALLLTLVELYLHGKAMSKLSAHDIRLFEASTLMRFMNLGMVVHKEQFGPWSLPNVIQNKENRRLFAKIHAAWFLDEEEFARELVEKFF